MPTTTPIPSSMPLPSSSPPVQPVIQTLDPDNDEDIAEDAPMPAQPLLPARRPRAASEPTVQVSSEAPEVVPVPVAVQPPPEVVPVPPAVQAPLEVAPVPAATDSLVEGVVVPAAKRARQYDLPPQQPWQPIPHLQPVLQLPAVPASSSSPAALPPAATSSSPTHAKDSKQQLDDDEENVMDTPSSGSSCSCSSTSCREAVACCIGPQGKSISQSYS